jgi:uncharacterized membrane protein
MSLLPRIAAPLHPILVHFSVALTSASLAFDVLAALLHVPSLAAAGWWSLAASVVATIGAVASGVVSRIRLPMEEGEARAWLQAHMALGPVFMGLALVMTVWRASLWEAGVPVVPWSYVAVMTGVVLVLTVQGYLGGELVYRFGAEVEGGYRRLPIDGNADAPPHARTRSQSHRML